MPYQTTDTGGEQPAITAWKDYYNSGHLSAHWLEVKVTAYCPCYLCCGKTDCITSSGKLAQPQKTAATDPAVIPLGTLIYLEGIGIFEAEDTGGAIKGNRIDIFMDDHQKALNFGIKVTRAYVLQEKL